jgi:exonuclease SbcD
VRFLHIADIHLGNQQYNVPGRFDDFGRAFLEAIELALDEQVDACIIAGDLFHKSSVEPKTLMQAEAGLERLRDAGIQVVAVHGNHDKVRYMAQFSWLEYLADRRLVCLLSPSFETEPLELRKWDDDTVQGAYVDIENVRIIGVPWLGASAPKVLAEVAAVWDSLDWSGVKHAVVVTHAGVEGQMPNMPGGLTFAELEPLRGKAKYIALGHLHKPYEVNDWIYNPGSLETCSFEEASYARGAYLVEVAPDGNHAARHIETVRRPFFDLHFKTDLYLSPGHLMDSLLAFVQQEQRRIEQELRGFPDPRRSKPVVRLVLRGNLSFDRTQLDMEAIRNVLRREIDALHVRAENRTTPLGMEAVIEDGMTRAELERTVFEALAQGDSRYSSQASAWADIMRQVKGMALGANDPVEIYELFDARMSELEEAGRVDN